MLNEWINTNITFLVLFTWREWSSYFTLSLCIPFLFLFFPLSISLAACKWKFLFWCGHAISVYGVYLAVIYHEQRKKIYWSIGIPNSLPPPPPPPTISLSPLPHPTPFLKFYFWDIYFYGTCKRLECATTVVAESRMISRRRRLVSDE